MGDGSKIINGEWSEGMIHGFCEIQWKDKKKYVGYCVKDKKEGLGIFYWPDQAKLFVGFWKNNKQDGVGKLLTSKSAKYGYWNQGERLNWFSSETEAMHQLEGVQQKQKGVFHKSLDELISFVLK